MCIITPSILILMSSEVHMTLKDKNITSTIYQVRMLMVEHFMTSEAKCVYIGYSFCLSGYLSISSP